MLFDGWMSCVPVPGYHDRIMIYFEILLVARV